MPAIGTHPEFGASVVIAPPVRQRRQGRAGGTGCSIAALAMITIGVLILDLPEVDGYLAFMIAVLLIIAGGSALLIQIVVLTIVYVALPVGREARALSTAALPPSLLRLQPPGALRFVDDHVVILAARSRDLAELVDAIAERTGAGPTLKGVAPCGWPVGSGRVGDRRAVWVVLVFHPIGRDEAVVLAGDAVALDVTAHQEWYLAAVRAGAQVATTPIRAASAEVDGALDGYRAARGANSAIDCPHVTAEAVFQKALESVDSPTVDAPGGGEGVDSPCARGKRSGS